MLRKQSFGLVLGLILTLGLLAPQYGTASPPPLITILTPGENAAVAAPIPITAEIQPEGRGFIRITLVDQNRNLLARQLLRAQSEEGAHVTFAALLPFEIPAEKTEALLTLSLLDNFSRPISLRSVPITLLSIGCPEDSSEPSLGSWLSIATPEPLDLITGGRFEVRGSITPVTDNPVMFELITNTGRVVGSSQLAVKTPGSPADFQITMVYGFITTLTDVRLVIRQTLDPYGVVAVLDSLLIELAP